MLRLVEFPAPPPPVVTQTDLENLLQLDKIIARQQKLRAALADAVLQKLTSGGVVEEGPRAHDIAERYQGGVKIQVLKVW